MTNTILFNLLAKYIVTNGFKMKSITSKLHRTASSTNFIKSHYTIIYLHLQKWKAYFLITKKKLEPNTRNLVEHKRNLQN